MMDYASFHIIIPYLSFFRDCSHCGYYYITTLDILSYPIYKRGFYVHINGITSILFNLAYKRVATYRRYKT